MTARQITLLTTGSYCLAGNIVGYCIYTSTISSDGLLSYFFVPYTFTWSLSALAGFDWLSYVFIILAYLFTLAVFFPIGLYFAQDVKNSAFRKYLSISQIDKEKIKSDFKRKNANILPATVDNYFIEFKELYNDAENTLSELLQTETDSKQNKKSFLSIIANKYTWLDKSNKTKLYNTCRFYLR